MSNSIMNAEDLMSNVRERVKSTILESVPDEKWKALIDSELKNFFESRVETWVQGSREIESPFRRMCREEIQNHVTSMLRSELQKQEWQRNWDGVVGDKLREVLVKSAPEMIAQWFASLASQQISIWASMR